jgi:hypothetical protein
MMVAFALAVALAATEPTSVIGKVVVVGPAQSRGVQVVDEHEKVTNVVGPLSDEVAQLQSLKVEVVGAPKDNGLDVKEYRIIDVGGGVKPMVGLLERSGERLMLRDGDADAIPLSLGPKTLQKLQGFIGAKVWVAGNKLISGELKVTKYGILRKPPELPSAQGDKQ